MRAEDLKISPFDHGFLYGAGFFETFRTYERSCMCLFEEHMDRLRTALAEYRIAMPYEDADILAAVQQLDDVKRRQGWLFQAECLCRCP